MSSVSRLYWIVRAVRPFEAPLDSVQAVRAAQVQRFVEGFPECSLAKWGLEIGEGWLPIVDELLTKLETYCADHRMALPRVGQIKEKFGTLRVYWCRNVEGRPHISAEHEAAVNALIAQATDLALRICECCGREVAQELEGPDGHEGGYAWKRCRCPDALQRLEGRASSSP